MTGRKKNQYPEYNILNLSNKSVPQKGTVQNKKNSSIFINNIHMNVDKYDIPREDVNFFQNMHNNQILAVTEKRSGRKVRISVKMGRSTTKRTRFSEEIWCFRSCRSAGYSKRSLRSYWV